MCCDVVDGCQCRFDTMQLWLHEAAVLPAVIARKRDLELYIRNLSRKSRPFSCPLGYIQALDHVLAFAGWQPGAAESLPGNMN